MTIGEIQKKVIQMLNKEKQYKWYSKTGREVTDFDDGVRKIRWKKYYPHFVLFETEAGTNITFTYLETYKIIRKQMG